VKPDVVDQVDSDIDEGLFPVYKNRHYIGSKMDRYLQDLLSEVRKQKIPPLNKNCSIAGDIEM
jgi:hypothetical protein